ncbi:MAG: DinB family protein [Anaerolineae bacterium]|nr:DinB family protein [Anaerolineae bacterium]
MTSQIISPNTKTELIAALNASHEAVRQLCQGFAPQAFFAHPAGVWSAAENVVHLVESLSAVTRGLKMPRLVLASMFGKAEASDAAKPASRDYATIQHLYVEALRQGAQASGRYVPQNVNVSSDFAAAQQRILANWASAGEKLSAAVAAWDEADLDVYRLPHPILGNLTLREMLLWTTVHNWHHHGDVERLV